MGELAVNVILRYIENKVSNNKPVSMKLKTSLIIRESVKNLN
jgi:DNA-binding LacI/PurR family transcriptional regulator